MLTGGGRHAAPPVPRIHGVAIHGYDGALRRWSGLLGFGIKRATMRQGVAAHRLSRRAVSIDRPFVMRARIVIAVGDLL